MGTFFVSGGEKLVGEVRVSGSKNAALPLLFATLVTDGVSVFRGVPDITDIDVAIGILSAYGVRFFRDGDTLSVDTRAVHDADPDPVLVAKIRASTYLLGGALARFGRVKIPAFGGCSFCPRPIDFHLAAARALGARQTGDLLEGKLRGGCVTLPMPSVGATVNAILMATRAEGTTVIRGAAEEPHVASLVSYLSAAGVDVTQKARTVTVRAGTPHGAEVSVIPDAIEAGTYLAAGIVTGGEVTVLGVSPSDLAPFLDFLTRAGIEWRQTGEGIVARGKNPRFASVLCEPHPGFPTDLGPVAAALLLTGAGGKITDTVFPDRLGYLSSLSAFGARYTAHPPSAFLLPSDVTPGAATAADLRGGASALLLALAAKGESRIDGGEKVFRGYEDPAGKLTALGAKIVYR